MTLFIPCQRNGTQGLRLPV